MLPARLKIEHLFALEVHGESMLEAGIRAADNGGMCVVWIDDSKGTLKYFYREEKRIQIKTERSEAGGRVDHLPE